MIEQELRELDEWIATKGLGWERRGDVWAVEPTGTVMYFPEVESWSPSTKPLDFAEVKREIEQQGWTWGLMYYITSPEYSYYFFVRDKWLIGEAWADSEELAGCLAFKAAVEATRR